MKNASKHSVTYQLNKKLKPKFYLKKTTIIFSRTLREIIVQSLDIKEKYTFVIINFTHENILNPNLLIGFAF